MLLFVLQEKVKNVGTVKHVSATDTAGDFPHFHLQYMMLKILGYHVDQVSLMSNDIMKPHYLQDTYLYAAKDEHPPFACTMNAARGPYVFHITVMGTEGTEVASMPGNSNWYYRFVPQMMDIQKTIEGNTYQPLDIVRKKFEIPSVRICAPAPPTVRFGCLPPSDVATRRAFELSRRDGSFLHQRNRARLARLSTT